MSFHSNLRVLCAGTFHPLAPPFDDIANQTAKHRADHESRGKTALLGCPMSRVETSHANLPKTQADSVEHPPIGDPTTFQSLEYPVPLQMRGTLVSSTQCHLCDGWQHNIELGDLSYDAPNCAILRLCTH